MVAVTSNTEFRTILLQWYRVAVPEKVPYTDIQEWLDNRTSHRYFWDTTDITGTINVIWLESQEDLILYRLTWG